MISLNANSDRDDERDAEVCLFFIVYMVNCKYIMYTKLPNYTRIIVGTLLLCLLFNVIN